MTKICGLASSECSAEADKRKQRSVFITSVASKLLRLVLLFLFFVIEGFI